MHEPHKTPAVLMGRVVLKNTEEYPFHNSRTTVRLSDPIASTDYTVETHIRYSNGDPGNIIVFDCAKNGFKIDYTGTAGIVDIEYSIISEKLCDDHSI